MADQVEVQLPEVPDDSTTQDHDPGKGVSSLRIRVVDNSKDGRPAVNISVPIRVVKFGMKMARAFSPEMRNADLDWESITAMIDEGERGKLVDVEDEAAHKAVEVWVE